jgi:hypothetical protein
MHPVLRLLVVNGLAGVVVALLFVGALLGLDVARLRTLLLADGNGIVALVLLTAGFVVTFCSVMMATAIMLHFRETGSGGGTKRGRVEAGSGPILARAMPRRAPGRDPRRG